MQRKSYVLNIQKQEQPCTSDFEASVIHAVLLALLERKLITQWQYEQCCRKENFISDAASGGLLPCFYRQR